MTEDNTKESGSTTKCMDSANSPGQMGRAMKASTSTIRNKAKAGSIMEAAHFTKVTG